ncbi:NADP oxidoreductase [Pantoea sp. GD03673]|uniref:NADP oxidoreductase n=1 Tax=Pantoea sp. GD03673 TaxID=2975364 RepID=UPI00244A1CC5|nr:NADP oxidoreductase [Pantoea sp. GD03673]MDH2067142.1 NADP oxidoreductase [Pantoea sp. GD03673]
MRRIGFIGLNALSESIVMAIFRAMPETQVFLYPSDCSRVQKLATAYPCWTLDDSQSVSDEAEIIILSPCRYDLSLISQSLYLRSVHTLVSLIPEISVQQLRILFRHPDCVRMAMLIQAENINPVVVLTDHAHHLEHLLWQTGLLTVTTSESQFDFMLRLTELSPLKL